MDKTRIILGFWALAVLFMTASFVLELLPQPQGVDPIESMVFNQDPKTEIAKPISLPDNWRNFPERPTATARYRATFEHPGAGQRFAVFISSYSGYLTAFVNGVELTTGGLLGVEHVLDQSLPYYAPIYPNVLKRDSNVIEIMLEPGGKLVGYLGPVYVGEVEKLRSSFHWHNIRAVWIPILMVMWQVLLSLLLIFLWISRPREKSALYCAFILIISCIHGIPIYLPASTDISMLVVFLGYVTNFWLSAFGLLFVASLANYRLPIGDRYILLLPASATLAYTTLPKSSFHYFELIIVVPFSLIICVAILYILIRSAVMERRWDVIAILISIIGAVSLAVNDTFVIMNIKQDSNFLHFRVVYILILPALSFVFIHKLILSMNEVDSLVGTLEDRIRLKEEELREIFDERQVIMRQQTLYQERQRIMRDVHDGLGGQLMSIIAMSENSGDESRKIELSARSALDDLRTMINSLGVEDDITGLMGTFRERSEQLLALRGIELEWKMIEIPLIDGLTPSHALNIIRIMQEAVTNAAKHSGASKVTIAFSLSGAELDQLNIEIGDNGCGVERSVLEGHGLKNMRRRAIEVNGSITIDRMENGTCVRLSIPVKS